MYARSAFQNLNEQTADEAFNIAWYFIRKTRDVTDETAAQAYLATEIMRLLERGERHRLVLANRAIAAYEKARPEDIDHILAFDLTGHR